VLSSIGRWFWNATMSELSESIEEKNRSVGDPVRRWIVPPTGTVRSFLGSFGRTGSRAIEESKVMPSMAKYLRESSSPGP
jgi:hypothetical protein